VTTPPATGAPVAEGRSDRRPERDEPALDGGFSRRTNSCVGVVVLSALGIGIAALLKFFFW
jgi:hypothetical protein